MGGEVVGRLEGELGLPRAGVPRREGRQGEGVGDGGHEHGGAAGAPEHALPHAREEQRVRERLPLLLLPINKEREQERRSGTERGSTWDDLGVLARAEVVGAPGVVAAGAGEPMTGMGLAGAGEPLRRAAGLPAFPFSFHRSLGGEALEGLLGRAAAGALVVAPSSEMSE